MCFFFKHYTYRGPVENVEIYTSCFTSKVIWLVLFYRVPTLVGYLMPNTVYKKYQIYLFYKKMFVFNHF